LQKNVLKKENGRKDFREPRIGETGGAKTYVSRLGRDGRMA